MGPQNHKPFNLTPRGVLLHFCEIFKMSTESIIFCEIFKMSTERTFFARFSKCRPKAHFLRDFQNVDRKHNFCEIFKMSTESTNFAGFSKCRPKAQFLRASAMESYLRLRRGVRICGHRWVGQAWLPSSIVLGGLEKRLPSLDLSALLLQFHKTSFSAEDPSHES